jgi:hypothetical protein
MRVMVLVKASPKREAGEMPGEDLLSPMTDFNEELAKAGVMLAGEGLHPSSKGVRVAFAGEAVEWLKRAPFQDGEVEIRPVFEDEDFGDELTPELREREAKLGRDDEARAEFERAAGLTQNARLRAMLEARATGRPT